MNMPWEQRGKNRYYYRREMIDGKVVRTYFGRGPAAEQAAAEDAAKRAIFELERQRRRQFTKDSKLHRLILRGSMLAHRAMFGNEHVHIDRDGELRRKNARTLRKEAQMGTTPCSMGVPPISSEERSDRV